MLHQLKKKGGTITPSPMSQLTIFIASSYDTAHERAVVGDAVRRLNGRYEPHGWRIRLHCWEDYVPEYRGIRKQSEYNEDLIKTSDIFIAIFRGNCGTFTQEEIQVWTDELHRVPVVFNISDPVVDKTAVDAFLNSKCLMPLTIVNDADIYTQVEAIVQNHIAGKPRPASVPVTIVAKELYATIPDDRSIERAHFGNLVRSVDDLAERAFHSRCRLTTGDEAKIPVSDYYTAILKDTVNATEERELLTALQCCITTRKPDVQLYYNHGDKIFGNHPQIQTAITASGLFNEPYDSHYRVRFNLVRWLHQQTILSVGLQAGIDIRDGWFIFCNLPVIPLEQLGIRGGTVMQQLSQLVKAFSFAVLGVDTQVTIASGEIDIHTLEEQMKRTDSVSKAVSEVNAEIRQRREQWLHQVSERIDTLLSFEVTDKNIVELTALIEKKEQLQAALAVQPRELLRTQMLMVQVNDTYPHQFAIVGRDADAQYLKVTQTADCYGIKDPTVEMMRMNYANYLHRQNRNAESLDYYETAINNIEALDDQSELLRYYIMHLYVTYINHLSFLGENERAITAIKRLIQKETEWEQNGIPKLERIANQSRNLACQLRIRPLSGDVTGLLNRSMDTYLQACSIPQDSFDQFIRAEVFCDLPICIAATAIDAQPYLRIDADQLQHNVDFFLGKVVDYADEHKEEENAMFYLSEALHNWAFFYSNEKGQQLKAREYCERALSVRRQIYADTRHPEKLYEVAQTLLMLGATYVNDIEGDLSPSDFHIALSYADECLSIYRSLNQEHFPEQDLRVHQALQLKGSILYYGGRKADGLALLRQACEWNLANPGNSYEGTFCGVAGEILKIEGQI